MTFDDNSRWRFRKRAGSGSPFWARRIRDIADLAETEMFAELPESPLASDIIFRASSPERLAGRGIRGYVAAMITGIAAAVGVLSLVERSGVPASSPQALSVDELVTGSNESNTVLLSDGSIVRLGPDSRLRIRGIGPDRQVTLEGRAFFVVESDPERPFRVVTPSGGVQALGTRFQVDADASDVRVVVLDGRVAVDGVGEQIELGAGQMVLRQAGTPGTVEAAPTLSELSEGWLGQFLVFKDTPLSRAVEDIESMYDVDVTVVGAADTEPLLTLWLTERSLDDALTIICNVIYATCSIEDSKVTIQLR